MQNRTADFLEAKVRIECKHQVALADAQHILAQIIALDPNFPRHVLAAAVAKADNEYHTELRKIAAKHGVQMSVTPQRQGV